MGPRQREAGFTLIEVLVTIGIVAIGIVAVVGGLQVVLASTSTQGGLADGELALRTVAEELRSAAAEAEPCASVEDYRGKLADLTENDAFPSSVSFDPGELTLEYFDGSVNGWSSVCPPGVAPQVHRLRFEVDPDRPSRSLGPLDVVVRPGG